MALATEILVLAVVGGVTVLLVRFLQQVAQFRKIELAIPGPPSLPLLGNALDFMSVTSDTLMQKILQMLDGRRELSRMSMMNTLMVVVSNAEDIAQLVRRPEFNSKAHFFYDFLDNPRSLVQLGGPEWRVRRKSLEPGFNTSVLNRFVEIFNEEAKLFVKRLPTNEPVDVLHPLRQASTRNFLRTAVCEDITHMEDEVMPFLEFFEVFHKSIIQRTFNPLLWSNTLYQMTPVGRTVVEMRDSLHALIMKTMAIKREEMKALKEGETYERMTLADILMELHDRAEIPEHDILDEIKTFFGANVETSVATLSWTLKVLSLLPEVQERVHAEVEAVLGDGEVTPDILPKFKYVECVLKETLRMYPAIPYVGRQCYSQTKLCGHVIPANCSIFLNIIGVHNDAEQWPEPTRFDPDRFLPENSKGRHPCAFIPFSSGSRNCIGGKYAMMVLKTILATTIRSYRVMPVDDHKDLKSLRDNMAFDLTSRLVGGTRVQFQPRT